MFEPPRKRVPGTLPFALVAALGVAAVYSAVSITPPLVGEALAFGDGGGGGDEGGDADGGSGSSNDPPPGFRPKLKLIPWLSGDWSRDGLGEQRTRAMVSKIKSIGRLLPNRGGPGGAWSEKTALRWNERYAIRWHIEPILFRVKSRPPSGRSSPRSPPPPASTPGGDEDKTDRQRDEGKMIGGTPALLREPGPRRKRRSLADTDKMMTRAMHVLQRDLGLLEAANHDHHAEFLSKVKGGLELVEKGSALVLTTTGVVVVVVAGAAGASAAAGVVALGTVLEGAAGAFALAHGYQRYSEMKLQGASTKTSLTAAAKLSAGEAVISIGGGRLASGALAGTQRVVNSQVARSMLSYAPSIQATRQVVTRGVLNLGWHPSAAYGLHRANNALSQSPATGGRPAEKGKGS